MGKTRKHNDEKRLRERRRNRAKYKKVLRDNYEDLDNFEKFTRRRENA